MIAVNPEDQDAQFEFRKHSERIHAKFLEAMGDGLSPEAERIRAFGENLGNSILAPAAPAAVIATRTKRFDEYVFAQMERIGVWGKEETNWEFESALEIVTSNPSPDNLVFFQSARDVAAAKTYGALTRSKDSRAYRYTPEDRSGVRGLYRVVSSDGFVFGTCPRSNAACADSGGFRVVYDRETERPVAATHPSKTNNATVYLDKTGLPTRFEDISSWDRRGWGVEFREGSRGRSLDDVHLFFRKKMLRTVIAIRNKNDPESAFVIGVQKGGAHSFINAKDNPTEYAKEIKEMKAFFSEDIKPRLPEILRRTDDVDARVKEIRRSLDAENRWEISPKKGTRKGTT